MSLRKVKTLGIGVLVAAVAAGTVWGAFTYRAAKAIPAETQVTGIARRGDLSVRISGTAALTAAQVESVTAQVSGTVEEILATEQEQLQADQVVLRLRNDALVQQVRQVTIDLQNEELKLRQMTEPDESDLRAARVRVQQAELTLSNRAADVKKLAVTAPVAGTVRTVEVKEGAEVNAGALLFTLAEPQPLRVDVAVAQLAAGYIKPGQKAEVILEGLGVVETAVTAITPRASGSASAEAAAIVELGLPDLVGLLPGMAATATIFTRHPDFPAGVSARGNVPQPGEVQVRAGVSGQVASVAVAEGDRVTVDARLAALTNSQVHVALEQAQNDLATARQQLATLIDPKSDAKRSVELQMQVNRVAQVRLNLENLEADRSRLVVRSPISGTVTGLLVLVGQQVTSGTALLTVENHDAFQLVIPVDELDIPQIHLGQAVVVEADAVPGRYYQGEVTKISRQGRVQDGVSTFDVTVKVAQPADLLPGMNALAEIVVAERQNVLSVPREAVVMRAGQAMVRRIGADGSPEMVRVQLGMRTDSDVEVTGGLREGDRIVTAVVAAQQSGGGGFPGMPGFGGIRLPGAGGNQIRINPGGGNPAGSNQTRTNQGGGSPGGGSPAGGANRGGNR